MRRVITYPTLGMSDEWEWSADVPECDWNEVEREFALILDAASDEKGSAHIPQFGSRYGYAHEAVYYAGDPTDEQSERLDKLAEEIWIKAHPVV